MARRSDHSREEIRDMALAAGEKIVTEEGREGLSARKVAAAIGYTVGTLYLVFENLDDLVLQINGRTLDRLHHRMQAAQDRLNQPEQRLLALGHTYIEFANENRHCWQMIFESRLPSDREMPDWFGEKVTRMFSMVEDSLRRLSRLDSDEEISRAARALWSGVHGICILAVTDKLGVVGVESIHDLTESIIRNYLAGLTNS